MCCILQMMRVWVVLGLCVIDVVDTAADEEECKLYHLTA